MDAGVTGVAFPIPKKYVNRFFEEGKNVFVKPATAWKQLKSGMKFVFYQSQEDTGFVGEARIKRIILSENPMQFFESYRDRIFLTKNELEEYMKSQGEGKREGKSKLWMAIELEDIKKYDEPVRSERFVPASEQYLRG
jgi:hypothetical protein